MPDRWVVSEHGAASVGVTETGDAAERSLGGDTAARGRGRPGRFGVLFDPTRLLPVRADACSDFRFGGER